MNLLFPETLARLQYFLRLLIWLVIFLVACALLFPLVHKLGAPDWVAYLIATPVYLMRLPCLDIPRCRDIGWSPWWLLLLFVPIVNFFLMLSLFFFPTQRGESY